MNPGPAPTMVYDWITPDVFFLFVGLFLVATVLTIFVKNLSDVLTEKRIKRDYAASFCEDCPDHEACATGMSCSAVKELAKVALSECFIDTCHRTGVIPAHTFWGLRYVCKRHEAGVYDWTAGIYDQDQA